MVADPLLSKRTPFVSVIIPVFNDAVRLALCLKALEEQTYPAERYEVIVVDNGSTENIEAVCKKFEQATYAHEPKPGSYAARNSGIALAKGDVLAFTDADCIPRQDWLEKGVKRLTSAPGCGLLGGRIKIFFRNPGRPTAAELYESVFALQQKGYIEKDNFGATANVFTFRSVFKEVGLFNDTMKSGGDQDWGKRVFSAGYPVLYADDVVVDHPARFSLAEIYRREARVAGGLYKFMVRKDGSSQYFLRKVARVFLRELPQDILKFLSRKDTNLNVWEKTKVMLVFILARYIRVLEWVKLRLGGQALR